MESQLEIKLKIEVDDEFNTFVASDIISSEKETESIEETHQNIKREIICNDKIKEDCINEFESNFRPFAATYVEMDGEYECTLCQRTFEFTELLQDHIKSHAKENEQHGESDENSSSHSERCAEQDLGSIKFAKRPKSDEFLIYMGMHTGERPFICEICSKTFSLKGNLKVHMHTHTGERPFKCEICSNAFYIKEHLKVHMRRHTGERPFECDICSEKFSRKGFLKNHLRLHTDEHPFKCDLCTKVYSSKQKLLRHAENCQGSAEISETTVLRVENH